MRTTLDWSYFIYEYKRFSYFYLMTEKKISQRKLIFKNKRILTIVYLCFVYLWTTKTPNSLRFTLDFDVRFIVLIEFTV